MTNKKISGNLEARLNQLGENKKIQIIVFADGKNGYSSLEAYLISENVNVIARVPSLHTFRVDLTKEQTYGVAEQPYVKAIIENQRIHSLD